MVEKCHLAAGDIAMLEVLNTTNVSKAIGSMESLKVTRLLVTDHAGMVLYDSYVADSAFGSYVVLPEVVQAMEGTNGNDVFSWEYSDGIMISRAATPIISYGTIVGCVYMMEYDADQGRVIQNLQKNTKVLKLKKILLQRKFMTLVAWK